MESIIQYAKANILFANFKNFLKHRKNWNYLEVLDGRFLVSKNLYIWFDFNYYFLYLNTNWLKILLKNH